jgi:hypothetical protein
MKNPPKPASAQPARQAQNPKPEPSEIPGAIAARHFRLGWWNIAVFLCLGVVLEILHGFKAGWYLDVSNSTRRLVWTLAHAHGTLFGILNIVFSNAISRLPDWNARKRRIASGCLVAATWLLPGGFFLGGFGIHGGDPGLGIFLVPSAAFLGLVAVILTALAANRVKAS